MKNSILALTATMILLAGCQNPSGPDNQQTTAGAAESQHPESPESWCYASKTSVPNSPDEQYNYQFIRLAFSDNNKVAGVIHLYPYGTDSQKGSLAGIYNSEKNEVVTEATLLAEGERYQEARDYRLLDNAIDLGFTDSNNQPVTLPRVSCDQYDALFREFHMKKLRNQINTTDRTRLMKSEAMKARAYSQEELNNIRFLERPVDLDHNFETQEFLLYVIDPTYCGTGGCDLYIINEKGQTLASISVVKLPVYTLVSTVADDQQKRGSWKELFVWSNGLRRLTPEGSQYPANASLEPVAGEELMVDHPEYYEVVLDYLDEQ